MFFWRILKNRYWANPQLNSHLMKQEILRVDDWRFTRIISIITIYCPPPSHAIKSWKLWYFYVQDKGNNRTIGKYTKPLNSIMNITFVLRNFLYWVENDLFFVILMIFSRVHVGFCREFRNGNAFYSIGIIIYISGIQK